AAFCLTSLPALTAAAWLRTPTPGQKRKPHRLLGLPPEAAEPAPLTTETDDAREPAERPAPTDLAPVVPELTRPAAGLENAVVSAAVAIPTSVPSPWAAPQNAPEPAAAPLPAKRPVVMCGTSVEFIG